MNVQPALGFVIRSFRPEDAAACKRLYQEGLIGGTLADNDIALDIENIQKVYMESEGCHFWVACDERDSVVGMIGVQHYEPGVGEIRRLRVAKQARRRGIGSALIETALRFCAQQQYLKITLDTFVEPEPAIGLCEKFLFHHERSREIHGRRLMYFYLDLYRKAAPSEPAD
ncbi:MAG TPA: GNAT family N-acetyltransferase [Tepidisphaeraceae bacterium]|nr:GNAT family N-acetyltransferase [Tepidisphaeraceae bacterium]